MAPASEPDAAERHGLVPFLQEQTQASLERLYAKPSVCLAVYRLVTPLERQLIMSLLWLDDPIKGQMLNQWAVQDTEQ